MHPIPTCPTVMENVVGARTEMSVSVAENAQTCSRKKQRRGLNADLSSGSASAIIPSYVSPVNDGVLRAEGASKLPEDTESIRWVSIALFVHESEENELQ